MIKSLWPPALYASPRVKPPPSPPDVLSPSSPPSLPRYPVRSSPLTTELHGSPRWRADTRHQAEPKPSSHSAAFVFPHPAREILRPKRDNSRMQADQGGARRVSAKKHPRLPIAGHSLALARESGILRKLHLALPIPTQQGGGGGVKGGLKQSLNLWTWERGRHHPPATRSTMDTHTPIYLHRLFISCFLTVKTLSLREVK